jgi:hypothetical protein
LMFFASQKEHRVSFTAVKLILPEKLLYFQISLLGDTRI